MQAREAARDRFEQHEAQTAPRLRATRHHLVVEAESVVDAVTAAGGLIFDRASAGWRVEVRLTTCDDDRALRILGVTASEGSDAHAAESTPDALIVAAGMLRANDAASTRFLAAAQADISELAVWGGEWPRELKRGIGRVEHRLSISARAFKLHALRAAGARPQSWATESFHSGPRLIDVAAPLTPV